MPSPLVNQPRGSKPAVLRSIISPDSLVDLSGSATDIGAETMKPPSAFRLRGDCAPRTSSNVAISYYSCQLAPRRMACISVHRYCTICHSAKIHFAPIWISKSFVITLSSWITRLFTYSVSRSDFTYIQPHQYIDSSN